MKIKESFKVNRLHVYLLNLSHCPSTIMADHVEHSLNRNYGAWLFFAPKFKPNNFRKSIRILAGGQSEMEKISKYFISINRSMDFYSNLRAKIWSGSLLMADNASFISGVLIMWFADNFVAH